MQPTHIVVVESGWVFAVDCPELDVSKGVGKCDARVIRRWGTTDGLGQLAVKGPTKETQLETCAIVTIPANKILLVLEVTSPW